VLDTESHLSFRNPPQSTPHISLIKEALMLETLSKNQLDSFEKFYNLLIETNKSFNLTRITERTEVYSRHFEDSLAISTWIPQNAKLIDIGTGAGFPSIPLAIARPDIEITAIDSLLKRVNFVNDVAKELNLTNLTCLHARAEDLAHNKAPLSEGGVCKADGGSFREKFDLATSRAVANLAILAEYHLPFLKIGGLSISMKSINATEEIKSSQENITLLAGSVPEVHPYQIPNTNITNTAIIIKKIAKTDEKFPRNAKKIRTKIN